jgi:hypothetical protein
MRRSVCQGLPSSASGDPNCQHSAGAWQIPNAEFTKCQLGAQQVIKGQRLILPVAQPTTTGHQ